MYGLAMSGKNIASDAESASCVAADSAETNEAQHSARMKTLQSGAAGYDTVPVCADEVMPEPDASDQTPDTCYGDAHARKIIWNFEDVRMLIGTDLPIFGGDSHPCVSLRLHDMAKPITVLTGLDHWLDNLMCNVPEVAVCIHLSGIVQKYEMIKTEELPELTDSQFSPALVKDIAQNILAFLKVNNFEEGHTYWLFKKEDHDVVKLYDLTNLKLGDETPDDQGTAAASISEPDDFPDHGANLNPFTVPAGMLFYRVAKSLLQDPDTRRRAATVTNLLHDAIKILHARRYAEIVSSAHFYIAEVLMAEDYREHEERETNRSADDYDSEPRPRDAKNGRHPSDDTLRSKLPQLCLSSARQTFSTRCRRYRPPRLIQNFSARCTSALSHVAQGLLCVLAKEKCKESRSLCAEGPQNSEGSSTSEDEPKMARRNESIPLPYESIQGAQQRSSPASDSVQEKSRSILAQENVKQALADGQNTSDNSCTLPGQNSSVCCFTDITSMKFGIPDVLQGLEPVVSNDGNDTVFINNDSNNQMSNSGLVEARPSKGVDAEGPSSNANPTSTGGPGAVVPSSACLWVQLSSVRYGVSSLTAKLKLLLLHQAALGYRIVASDAFHNKQFENAADNVDICVRCCVAVSYQLQLDAAHLCQQDYPLMKESLGLASEIFYEWAKVWDQGSAPVKTAKKTSKKSNKKHSEPRTSGACEYNCTAAAEGGDASAANEGLSEMTDGKMIVILERLVPQEYRAQFEMPVSPSSAYSCMMLSQCYLFLEAGGRLNAATVLHADTRDTDDRGTRTPVDDPTSGCSLRLTFEDEMVHRSPDIVARLAHVMNDMAGIKFRMVQSACMCADERQRALLLDAMVADRDHLKTAISLFIRLGDTGGAAISMSNLAKYHRLCAYFSPSRIEGTALTKQEAEHHRQAASLCRQALFYIEERIKAGILTKVEACKVTDTKPPKRMNLIKKEAGSTGLASKKLLQSQRKPDPVSTDQSETKCDSSNLQTDGSASCGGQVAYEPRELSIEQAYALGEKLKLDLVLTITTHADFIRERGLSEAEAGGTSALELLSESVSMMRRMLAQSPAVNYSVMLARNSLRILALRSGLSPESECKPAEWLPVLQGLQAALYSRRHFTTALLCTTSAVFSLLASQSGSTGECVRACVTCLVQSCYVVVSCYSSPASDLPLVMKDGRRFEVSLPDFGLLSPCQAALDWQVSPQAPFKCDAEREGGDAGGAAGAPRVSDTEDKGTTSAAGGANKPRRRNERGDQKTNIVETKGSAQMKGKNVESFNSQNSEKEEGSKAGRSNRKNKKGIHQKQDTRSNSDEAGRDNKKNGCAGKCDGRKSTRNVNNDGEKDKPGSGGGDAGRRKLSSVAYRKGAEKDQVEEDDDCSGRRWNAALLLEVERCLRAALQRHCQLAIRSPQELGAAWRGSDATVAVAAYRATLHATSGGSVGARLLTALVRVQQLLDIPATPTDPLLPLLPLVTYPCNFYGFL